MAHRAAQLPDNLVEDASNVLLNMVQAAVTEDKGLSREDAFVARCKMESDRLDDEIARLEHIASRHKIQRQALDDELATAKAIYKVVSDMYEEKQRTEKTAKTTIDSQPTAEGGREA